jgi:hypothetical protein
MILAARPEETLLMADVVPGDYGPTHPEGHSLKNRHPELYKPQVAMQAAFEGEYTYKIPPNNPGDYSSAVAPQLQRAS